MKKLLLFLFLILCKISISQEIKTDNNLTGLLSTSTNSKIGLIFTGENSFNKDRWDIVSFTNYSLTFNPNLSENELTQRLNYDFKTGRYYHFTSYQFNYSLVRGINTEHFVGLGSGFKTDIKFIKLSLSYAILYQNINESNLTSNIFRHSLRAKFKIENKFLELSSEYFYQPDVTKFNDFIITGTSKLSVCPQNRISFTIQDVLNYRSKSSVRTIHNLTVGVRYKFDKKFTKD